MKMLTNILQWAGLTYGDMGHPFLRYLFHWWRAFWGGTVSINISFNDLGLLQQGLEPRSKVCEVNARPNEPKRGGDICIFKRKPKLFKILGCRVLWWPSLFRYQVPLWFFLQTLCFLFYPDIILWHTGRFSKQIKAICETSSKTSLKIYYVLMIRSSKIYFSPLICVHKLNISCDTIFSLKYL